MKLQLYWHQRNNPSAKITVTGKQEQLLGTLVSAFNRHNLLDSAEPTPFVLAPESQPLSDTSHNDINMCHNETDTDSEYKEEELYYS